MESRVAARDICRVVTVARSEVGSARIAFVSLSVVVAAKDGVGVSETVDHKIVVERK